MLTVADILQELEQEGPATRRVLERLPADKLQWKPHSKSMRMGQLAMHVASLPGNIAEISRTAFDVKTRWSIPRAAFFRSVMLNQWYHHRGQLTVYLRQTGASVPAVYGDSADERAIPV